MSPDQTSINPLVERHLGSLEAQIMRVLWERPRLSVREVVDLLADGRERAYTTVMTVMNRLFEKGLLEREGAGRAYIYRPAVTEREFLDSLSKRMVQSVLEEFGDAALIHFVGEVREGDPKGLEKLRKLMAEGS